MTVETTKRLHDVVAACRAIREFTEGLDFAGYDASLLVRSGVERQLEIIGEALGLAARADQTLALTLPDLPRIVALRNRIIHGYDTVDDEIVWDIVQNRLPGLELRVQSLIDPSSGE